MGVIRMTQNTAQKISTADAFATRVEQLAGKSLRANTTQKEIENTVLDCMDSVEAVSEYQLSRRESRDMEARLIRWAKIEVKERGLAKTLAEGGQVRVANKQDMVAAVERMVNDKAADQQIVIDIRYRHETHTNDWTLTIAHA
jgi:ribosomal 50S subunit-recycling heat shock protein